MLNDNNYVFIDGNFNEISFNGFSFYIILKEFITNYETFPTILCDMVSIFVLFLKFTLKF